MDENHSAELARLYSTWNWDPIIISWLVIWLAVFFIGWFRLRKQSPNAVLTAVWRPILFTIGILLIGISLLSPIDLLGEKLFAFHMIQHLLLAMFAPPLLLAPNPMPIMMWGLPMPIRRFLGRVLFSRRSPIRPLLTLITKAEYIWMAFFVILWGWHSPEFYNLALQGGFMHTLEHVLFFWSAMFLWWHITGVAPHFHKRPSYLARIAFTLACLPANMMAGVVIALAQNVIYTHYETVPFREWLWPSYSVMADQALGGAIMWVPGSMMYAVGVAVLLFMWIGKEQDKSRS